MVDPRFKGQVGLRVEDPQNITSLREENITSVREEKFELTEEVNWSRSRQD